MRRSITVDEFKTELVAQGVKAREDLAFVCPACKTVQSARDLIKAGAGKTFDDVETFVAFSCFGRWTGRREPEPDKPGLGCNWTLGGLFHIHELEVVSTDGVKHMRFELATPAAAQAHQTKFAAAS